MGNQPKLSELPWNRSGPWALSETSGTWSTPWAACVARLWSANQLIFTELSQWGCSPGLEFSRELPPFIYLQLPCLDLPQLVLAQAKAPPSKSVLSSFWVVTLGYTGPGTDLWQSTRPAEISGFPSSRVCIAGSAALRRLLWQWSIARHCECPQGSGLKFILPLYPDCLSRKAGLACKCDFTETWQKTEIP